ncbi:TetR/AcrR family transcriptional regulator [Nocardia cyriacigeorgica]|uniref:TetR/AcrR family transcriptional regulator n=1 Tax=Nocardia cyriacigeorgica TaxID=135487 RepID=UPI0018951663|nr:helix-turn-helix domain-containing protein [Nocardia cyriacigeorgica]MBF6439028.1 helix-turn-helix transcriptional regulator [Nocardia cyriacigeorgica]
MGRPRGFDEDEVIAVAARLFAERAYDGVSVDDLVNRLGVHRNSLYKVFGSKRGLYLAALRWYVEHRLRPVLARVGDEPNLRETLPAAADLDFLLLAAVERAPVDPDVAREIAAALDALDAAVSDGATPTGDTAALSATVLGLRLRARASGSLLSHPSERDREE